MKTKIILLTLLLCWSVRASTVIGNLVDSRGSPFNGTVTFAPSNPNAMVYQGTSLVQPTTVSTMAGGGSFSVSLVGTVYRMTISGQGAPGVSPPVFIVVPNDNNTYNFNQLTTNVAIFTYYATNQINPTITIQNGAGNNNIFTNPTIIGTITGNGSGLSNISQTSLVGTITNPVNTTGNISTLGISSKGAGFMSEQYGAGAQANNQSSVVVGNSAIANATQSISIGASSGNGAGGANGGAFGAGATNNLPGAFAFGPNAVTTAANRATFGSTGSPMSIEATSNLLVDANTSLIGPLTTSTNATVNGNMTVNGNITETSPAGWLYTNLAGGTILRTNIITGASKTVGSNGPETNSASITAQFFAGSAQQLTNGVAPNIIAKLMPTPIMLYSSFVDLFPFSSGYENETWVTNTVNLLTALRYSTVCSNIALEDDHYQPTRTSTGGLAPLATNFPNGFPYITSFANSKGFQMDSYLSRLAACSFIPPTTPATEGVDVLSNLVWGFSGMIFDDCVGDLSNGKGISELAESIRLFNEVNFNSSADTHARLTTSHGMWLLKTQGLGGYGDVVPWESMLECNIIGVPVNNAVGTFAGANDVLTSLKQQESFSFYISPGHFVDPTSFGFSLGKPLIRQIVSAYAMCSSPIQIGQLNVPFEDLLNAEWRSVWQDPLCQCAYPIYSNNLAEVHLKPRANGQYSLLFCNMSNTPQTITISNTQIGVPYSQAFQARDPWNYTNIGTPFVGSFTWTVGASNTSSSIYLINLTPVNPSATYTGPVIPPAQAYPPYATLLWTSNPPSYYASRTTYLLQNNQTGNNWESQTQIATTANGNYTPNKNLTNAICIYDWPSMAVSNNTLLPFVYDRGPNNYNMLANNDNALFGPFITNNASVLGGKPWAYFTGAGYGGTWATGMSTNFATTPTPATSALSIFIVATLPTNQAANVMMKGMDANNVFFNDGTADPKWYYNNGSQMSFTPLGSTNSFQVIEIFDNNTAGDYIKTNGVQAVTGTALGNNPLHGLIIGARESGSQNLNFNIAWYGAFTNMSSADRTSLTTWLQNWSSNTLPTQSH